MDYLRIKNWKQFQHYTDRNPPWIKLHRTLLDDYEFARLQDASKAHLIMIWLFASQANGRVPNDAAFLRNKLGFDKPPDLKVLIAQGLLIPEQVASTTQAERKQDASDTIALARSQETEAYKASEAYKTGETDSGARLNGASHPIADDSPTVETLPCIDGTQFAVKQALVTELEPLYPQVDVPATLREMKGWLIGNPQKRKTRRGIQAFITRWLHSEQQKATAH